MTARTVSARAWRVLGSTTVLVVAVLFLSISAISGNVFQNTSRSDLKNDLAESRHETTLSRKETAALRHQLDLVKGEQECRSQIASESELIAGSLLAGVGKLLIAANDRDARASQAAIQEIATATVALGPALKARQDSVDLCAGAKAPPAAAAVQAPSTTTSTSTTVARKPAARRTTAASRPTSTTGTTTTTTIHRSSPRPTSPPSTCVVAIPFVPIPGVPTCL